MPVRPSKPHLNIRGVFCRRACSPYNHARSTNRPSNLNRTTALPCAALIAFFVQAKQAAARKLNDTNTHANPLVYLCLLPPNGRMAVRGRCFVGNVWLGRVARSDLSNG